MNKSLAKNFQDGYEAFDMVTLKKGFYHTIANPMRKNTTSYREWQRGWDAAYFKNLEKLNGLGARS
jgi:hypothetical protein